MAKKKNTAGHRKERKEQELRGPESHASAENNESASQGDDTRDFEHEATLMKAEQLAQHIIAEAATTGSDDHEGDTLVAAEFGSSEGLSSPEQVTSDQSFTSSPPRRLPPPRVATAVSSSFNPYTSPQYTASVRKSQKKEPHIDDTDKKHAYPKMDTAFATDTFFQPPRKARTHKCTTSRTKNVMGGPNTLNPQFETIVASANVYGEPATKDQLNKFKAVSDKVDPPHPLGLTEGVSPTSLDFKSFSNNEKQKFKKDNNIMNTGFIGYTGGNVDEKEAGHQRRNMLDNMDLPMIDMDMANPRRKLSRSERRSLDTSSSSSLRRRTIITIAQVKAVMADTRNRSSVNGRMDTPNTSNGDSSQDDFVEDGDIMADMDDLQRRSREQSPVRSCMTKTQTHVAGKLLQTLNTMEAQKTIQDETLKQGTTDDAEALQAKIERMKAEIADIDNTSSETEAFITKKHAENKKDIQQKIEMVAIKLEAFRKQGLGDLCLTQAEMQALADPTEDVVKKAGKIMDSADDTYNRLKLLQRTTTEEDKTFSADQLGDDFVTMVAETPLKSKAVQSEQSNGYESEDTAMPDVPLNQRPTTPVSESFDDVEQVQAPTSSISPMYGSLPCTGTSLITSHEDYQQTPSVLVASVDTAPAADATNDASATATPRFKQMSWAEEMDEADDQVARSRPAAMEQPIAVKTQAVTDESESAKLDCDLKQESGDGATLAHLEKKVPRAGIKGPNADSLVSVEVSAAVPLSRVPLLEPPPKGSESLVDAFDGMRLGDEGPKSIQTPPADLDTTMRSPTKTPLLQAVEVYVKNIGAANKGEGSMQAADFETAKARPLPIPVPGVITGSLSSLQKRKKRAKSKNKKGKEPETAEPANTSALTVASATAATNMSTREELQRVILDTSSTREQVNAAYAAMRAMPPSDEVTKVFTIFKEIVGDGKDFIPGKREDAHCKTLLDFDNYRQFSGKMNGPQYQEFADKNKKGKLQDIVACEKMRQTDLVAAASKSNASIGHHDSIVPVDDNDDNSSEMAYTKATLIDAWASIVDHGSWLCEIDKALKENQEELHATSGLFKSVHRRVGNLEDWKQGKIGELQKNVSSISEMTKELEEREERIEVRISDLQDSSLQLTSGDEGKETDGTDDGVSATINRLSQKIRNIECGIKVAERSIEKHAVVREQEHLGDHFRMENIEGEVYAIDCRMTNVEETSGEMTKEIRDINGKVEAAGATAGRVFLTCSNLEGKVDTNLADVAKLKTNLQTGIRSAKEEIGVLENSVNYARQKVTECVKNDNLTRAKCSDIHIAFGTLKNDFQEIEKQFNIVVSRAKIGKVAYIFKSIEDQTQTSNLVQRQVASLQKALVTAETDTATRHSSLNSQLTDYVDALDIEVKALSKNFASSDSRVTGLGTKIEKAVEEFRGKVGATSDRIAGQSSKISDLERRIIAYGRESDRLKQTLGSRDAAMEVARKDMQKATTTVKDFCKKTDISLAANKTKSEKLEKLVNDSHSVVKNMAEETERLRHELDVANMEIDAAKNSAKFSGSESSRQLKALADHNGSLNEHDERQNKLDDRLFQLEGLITAATKSNGHSIRLAELEKTVTGLDFQLNIAQIPSNKPAKLNKEASRNGKLIEDTESVRSAPPMSDAGRKPKPTKRGRGSVMFSDDGDTGAHVTSEGTTTVIKATHEVCRAARSASDSKRAKDRHEFLKKPWMTSRVQIPVQSTMTAAYEGYKLHDAIGAPQPIQPPKEDVSSSMTAAAKPIGPPANSSTEIAKGASKKTTSVNLQPIHPPLVSTVNHLQRSVSFSTNTNTAPNNIPRMPAVMRKSSPVFVYDPIRLFQRSASSSKSNAAPGSAPLPQGRFPTPPTAGPPAVTYRPLPQLMGQQHMGQQMGGQMVDGQTGEQMMCGAPPFHMPMHMFGPGPVPVPDLGHCLGAHIPGQGYEPITGQSVPNPAQQGMISPPVYEPSMDSVENRLRALADTAWNQGSRLEQVAYHESRMAKDLEDVKVDIKMAREGMEAKMERMMKEKVEMLEAQMHRDRHMFMAVLSRMGVGPEFFQNL